MFVRLLICVCVLGLGSGAFAQPAQTTRPPDWVTRPTPERIFWAYPARAMSERLEGQATILCTVTVEGLATACRVVSETPEGYDFGEAALTLAEDFRFRPALRNGRPEASEVRVPISFRQPEEGVMPIETVTPEALAMARRLVVAMQIERSWSRSMDSLASAIMIAPAAGGDLTPEERRRVAEATRAVVSQYRQQVLESYARTYASNLRLADLTAITAFYESPLGQRYIASSMGMEPYTTEFRALMENIQQNLRERLCGPIRPCVPLREELG